MRAASLCPVVLVWLCAAGTVEAGDKLPVPGDPAPCNEFCRAWLAWRPERSPLPAQSPASDEAQMFGTQPLTDAFGSPPEPPRRSEGPRRAALPPRSGDMARRSAKGGPASPSKPAPRIVTTARRAPPLPPVKEQGPSSGELQSADGSKAGIADLPQRVMEPADAAILAKPLYEPPPPAPAEIGVQPAPSAAPAS